MNNKLACCLTAIRNLAGGLPSCGCCLALLFFCPHLLRAADPSAQAVPVAVEQAVLDEDWPAVTTQLAGVETNGASATLRLIKGHACLALNQNNQSYCLFLSLTSRTDCVAYGDWATSFAARNSDHAIAHYFSGDALARQTNWTAAIASFTKALALNTNHALTLNARGVVYAHLGKVKTAKKDFLAAIDSSGGTLADAYNNAGYLWIQRKEDAIGAQNDFANAIQHSFKFVLALHGRGCSELLLVSNTVAAADLGEAVANSGAILPLLLLNQERYAILVTGEKSTNFLADLQKPGTTMSVGIGGTFDPKTFSFGANGNYSYSDTKLGGAYADVKIQNGNWPFLPLYGLAYWFGD